jgi:hypothetical protein
MGTTERSYGGVLPTTNDLAAGVAIAAVYITRWGVVAEGGSPWWVLAIATDLILPVLAAVWLLCVPTYQVVERVRE